MATNPYFTQYHTQRFSFIGSPQQRDGTYVKDQRFLNMYPELIKSPITDGKKYYLKKRPGLAGGIQLPAGAAQGIYFWNGVYYTAVGGILYRNGTSILNLSQTSTRVGFCEYRDDTQDLLFVCDGNEAWLITTSNTINHITDPNFPAPHIPTPVFLDGYIFIPAASTQTIHNSTLLTPATWPVDGFIDAEMFPDNIVGLAKVQNYIAAIGGQSIEWFYDNANATGSPLNRNAPAVSQFGCPAPMTINQTEMELILVGQTANGGRTVWVVNGFQPTEIANEPVREALDLEGTILANANGMTIQCAGHKWYILNLLSAQRTFVYDFEEQMWHEWSSGTTQTNFQWAFSADSGNGEPTFINYTTGLVASMTPTTYTDIGATINCEVITSKIDFDTIMRKRFFRMSLICDGPNGDNNVPITVNWSDDDYNTWVGNFTLNINSSYPTVTQMGFSRRRAYQFIYQQPYPLRMESFELDIIQEVRR
jgi:hypothetical protein